MVEALCSASPGVRLEGLPWFPFPILCMAWRPKGKVKRCKPWTSRPSAVFPVIVEDLAGCPCSPCARMRDDAKRRLLRAAPPASVRRPCGGGSDRLFDRGKRGFHIVPFAGRAQRSGPGTCAMIRVSLGSMENCQDCTLFALASRLPQPEGRRAERAWAFPSPAGSHDADKSLCLR